MVEHNLEREQGVGEENFAAYPHLDSLYRWLTRYDISETEAGQLVTNVNRFHQEDLFAQYGGRVTIGLTASIETDKPRVNVYLLWPRGSMRQNEIPDDSRLQQSDSPEVQTAVIYPADLEQSFEDFLREKAIKDNHDFLGVSAVNVHDDSLFDYVGARPDLPIEVVEVPGQGEHERCKICTGPTRSALCSVERWGSTIIVTSDVPASKCLCCGSNLIITTGILEFLQSARERFLAAGDLDSVARIEQELELVQEAEELKL